MPWKPFGYTVKGFVTSEICECGRRRQRNHGDEWDYTAWPSSAIPTVDEYNKSIKIKPKDIHMSKFAIGCLATVGVVGFLLVSVIGSILSFRNEAVRAEAGIVAQYDQNRNNYDNMFKKFKEVAQVPTMYSEDLKGIYDAAISGRYGADGSRAMFQWITEHNPQVDSSLYAKVQVVVEAGRNAFEADQKMLIDKRREYEILLNSNRGVMINWLLKYPKIDLTKYDIVTSGTTEDAFETKKADEVKLR